MTRATRSIRSKPAEPDIFVDMGPEEFKVTVGRMDIRHPDKASLIEAGRRVLVVRESVTVVAEDCGFTVDSVWAFCKRVQKKWEQLYTRAGLLYVNIAITPTEWEAYSIIHRANVESVAQKPVPKRKRQARKKPQS